MYWVLNSIDMYWSYLRNSQEFFQFSSQKLLNGSCSEWKWRLWRLRLQLWKTTIFKLSTLIASKSMSNLNLAIWVSIWFNDWLSLVSFCKLKVWYSTTENHIQTSCEVASSVTSSMALSCFSLAGLRKMQNSANFFRKHHLTLHCKKELDCCLFFVKELDC